jgi:3-oxoacyl-[acyl-carrier-protein] synthase II
MGEGGRCIIRGLSLLSALGASGNSCLGLWQSGLVLGEAPMRLIKGRHGDVPVFPLSSEAQAAVIQVASDERYRRLDRTVHLSIAAARGTFNRLKSTGVTTDDIGCISIGSSRGPTIALEQSVRDFELEGRVATLTSPITTAGNISSWVAQEYIANHGAGAAELPVAALSTSMTCSSALHSLLVARSFVGSGMARSAIFGGAEACLTPYTVAQLQALRIYGDRNNSWPCRPLDFLRGENSVVLGEGAGSAVLVSVHDDAELIPGDLELSGIGWALESIPSPTGISHDGAAFERAMRMAVAGTGSSVNVGAVVLHAPGSRLGDEAELGAVRRVFGDTLVCSTKHLTGHTYGASGMLSLGLAEALLGGMSWPGFPYFNRQQSSDPLGPEDAVVINSAGFGGNAISLVVNRAPYARR